MLSRLACMRQRESDLLATLVSTEISPIYALILRSLRSAICDCVEQILGTSLLCCVSLLIGFVDDVREHDSHSACGFELFCTDR
jgi:hypothetical protein